MAVARRDLQKVGVTDQPGTVLADTGYWHKAQMERIIAAGSVVLIPPDGRLRSDTRFLLRGRAAVRSEWRMIADTHNLLELHQHWTTPATG